MVNRGWVCCVGLLCLLPIGRGDAMQMELTRLELCSVADSVVIAAVADVEATWAPGQEGAIERRVQLDIHQSLRGSQSGSLELILPGGRIGQAWTHVEDTPTLTSGLTYMLFLDQTAGGWRAIGGEAGAVAITTRTHKGESLKTALASVEGCDAQ